MFQKKFNVQYFGNRICWFYVDFEDWYLQIF